MKAAIVLFFWFCAVLLMVVSFRAEFHQDPPHQQPARNRAHLKHHV